jgi:signal transduction histidine kinase/CheY-like chemotaxis protein
MSERVLVLDDEPGVLKVCERLLTRAGYLVKTSQDPRRALSLLKTLKWDLLVIDIRMPGMSGFDVIAEVRHLQPDMAILVMTGFGTVETAIQALQQGVDGLVLKPFDAEPFLQAVAQALESNRRKQEALRSRMLRPLFDVTEALFSEFDPGQLNKRILNIISTYFRCEQAAVYEQKGDRLFLLAAQGVVPVDETSPLIAYVLSQERHMRLEVGLPMPQSVQQAMSAAGWHAALFGRASRPDARFWFLAARSDNPDPFYDSDLDLLVVFARQAALAIENARLYDALRVSLKQLESSQQALLQAEKMAAAGRLLASVSHEINNPLQSVENCLHLSQEQALPPERRAYYFNLALQEMARLRETVQQMLSFYRRSDGQKEDVDLHDLLRRAARLLAAQFEKRGIAIVWQLEAGTPVLQGVANQLQQVFVNLMLNAYDAMPAGGQLTIATAVQDGNLEIAFTDSGPGISPDLQGQIFEPFMTTKDGGTGLGLAISYNIVHAHGGNLLLDPNWKQGARFVIVFPQSTKRRK